MEVAELAISAGAGLAGALIGAGATMRAARAERRSQERSELVESLTALLAALDRLNIELGHLPSKTRLALATDRTLARLPNLEFFLAWVSRKTIGRDGMRVIDEFVMAGRRAMLLAPEDVLEAFEHIAALLSDDRENEEWASRWSHASEQLTAEARKAVSRYSPRARRRLLRAPPAANPPRRRIRTCG